MKEVNVFGETNDDIGRHLPRPEPEGDGRVTEAGAAGHDAVAGRGSVQDELDMRLVPVYVVDPLVGRLPDDGPDPEGQVRGHHVHEPEAGHQAEALHNYL